MPRAVFRRVGGAVRAFKMPASSLFGVKVKQLATDFTFFYFTVALCQVRTPAPGAGANPWCASAWGAAYL